MKPQPIIGLEVHIELSTKSGLFCGCPADHFGKPPNNFTCPICLGLPGSLPTPNKQAIEWTILLGLALDCKINHETKFDRKHYLYPDLAKGYQISQYDQPIAINGTFLGVRIRRVHLEEDTAKIQHTEINGEKVALIDFNRSGVPLVEIVTEPDFRSVDQVDIFLKKLQRLIRYLAISNADMEKGSMRLEPSISLSSDGKLPNYRVELKNINSFRFARKALEYEIKRQQKEPHVQQTRGWNETKNATIPQREKEEAHDYRYFPEPDIPPIDTTIFNPKLPELPDAKYIRFVKNYKISEYQANILTDTPEAADRFEKLTKKEKSFSPKDIANSLINNRPLVATATDAIPEEIIEKVIKENPQAVTDYKSGNQGAIGPLIGAVLAKGNFDKQLVIAKLKAHLV